MAETIGVGRGDPGAFAVGRDQEAHGAGLLPKRVEKTRSALPGTASRSIAMRFDLLARGRVENGDVAPNARTRPGARFPSGVDLTRIGNCGTLSVAAIASVFVSRTLTDVGPSVGHPHFAAVRVIAMPSAPSRSAHPLMSLALARSTTVTDPEPMLRDVGAPAIRRGDDHVRGLAGSQDSQGDAPRLWIHDEELLQSFRGHEEPPVSQRLQPVRARPLRQLDRPIAAPRPMSIRVSDAPAFLARAVVGDRRRSFHPARTSTSCGAFPTGTVACAAPVFASRIEAVLSDLFRHDQHNPPALTDSGEPAKPRRDGHALNAFHHRSLPPITYHLSTYTTYHLPQHHHLSRPHRQALRSVRSARA